MHLGVGRGPRISKLPLYLPPCHLQPGLGVAPATPSAAFTVHPLPSGLSSLSTEQTGGERVPCPPSPSSADCPALLDTKASHWERQSQRLGPRERQTENRGRAGVPANGRQPPGGDGLSSPLAPGPSPAASLPPPHTHMHTRLTQWPGGAEELASSVEISIWALGSRPRNTGTDSQRLGSTLLAPRGR